MRTTHASLLGLVMCAGALAAGCTSEGPGESIESSRARLITSVDGSGASSVHVTATADATADVVLERTVDVGGDGVAVLDLALAPASYTFAIDLMGGASGETRIGGGTAHATLFADITTEIRLSADASAEAEASGEAGGEAGGEASGEAGGEVSVGAGVDVAISVNAAPTIESVSVETAADGSATIHVSASDADGDVLTFFWSGAGIDGTVEGGASFTIAAATSVAASADATVRILVQDARGAASAADAALTFGSEGLGAEGEASGEASAEASGGAEGEASASISLDACIEANAECTAECHAAATASLGGALAEASCNAECSLELATCASL